MKKNSENEFEFGSTNLIHYLFSKWKPLLIISVLAFIISVVASLIITPKFKSTVIMFPASSVSVSEALVSTTSSGSKSGILAFGEEEETEQLLQILNSDEIKENLIQKFNLFDHYQIDASSKYKYTELYSRMESNISFRKTEYMSVRIDVLDEDPQMAADMANELAFLLDATINRMQKKRADDAFLIVSKEYKQLQEDISELQDSLRKIGELGIYDVEAQSQGLNEAWLEAVSSGKTSLANKLQEQINNLGKYGGDYMFLKEFLSNESGRLSLLKDKYTRAKVDTEQSLPHSFIVSEGRVAEKKAYPRRSIIVILSTFSAFLFALFILIVFDSFKQNA